MNKVQVIFWFKGIDMSTDNRSFFYDIPTEEVTPTGFTDNVMKRVRENWPEGAREVINIINLGEFQDDGDFLYHLDMLGLLDEQGNFCDI